MLMRIVLLATGMATATGVVAQDQPRFAPEFACHAQTTLMRKLALQSDFDVPLAINALIVNVIDGKLPQVRQQLNAMNRTDAARWRQSALVMAAYAKRPAIVAGLLDDGAEVDGEGEMPQLKSSFRHDAIAEVDKDPASLPNPRPGSTEDFDEGALLWFSGDASADGTALIISARCNDVATVDVLLQHRADVFANPFPKTAMNALEASVSLGNAEAVRHMLDHGIDVCSEDRLLHQRQLQRKVTHFSTIADWARRKSFQPA